MLPGSVRVGPYVLQREVARGAMGVVYEAQAPDGSRVALKVLAQVTSGDALARFDRERRLLAELSGAHGFVSMLDAGEHQGRPWLVMPFMAGGSLRDRLRRGPLSVEAAVALGHQLGMAIGRAHARGIVHRDLKPENVLFERMDDEAPAKIADLGVARHFRATGVDLARSAGLSKSGALLGTACYMAPEQVIDARRVEPPADVFALAQIIYECLAGVTPFARESLQEAMSALADGKFEPLRKRAPEAPAWLEATLARALAVDPARRFEDGTAFAGALALGASAPVARRPGRTAVTLAIGGAALAALGGVALVVGRRDDAPIAPAPAPPPTAVVVTPPAPVVVEPVVVEPVVVEPVAPDPGPVAPPVGPDPTNAGDWLRRGGALQQAGQLDRAIDAYRRALELNPRKTTRVFLAFALIEADRLDEALLEAERLVAMSPDPASLNARGQTLIAMRQLRGRFDLERSLQRMPRQGDTWAQLSVGRARARDWTGARDAAEKAITLGGPPGPALRSRGLARLALGDAGGREDLERYRAGLDAGKAARDAELQGGLARCGAPTDPAPDDRARATRLVEEAWLTQAQRDGGATRRLVELALGLSPDHAGALAMRGAGIAGEQGLALLDRAITLGPAEGWMFVERAMHKLERRDYAGVVDDTDQAIARDGTSFDVLRVRAPALKQAKDPRAMDAARELTRVAPDRPSGWILLSQAHRDRAEATAALAPAVRATEVAPTEPEAWRELGQTLLQLTRWSDAIEPFERVLALVPDDPGGRAGRGIALGFAGRHAEGIEDMERALKALPDNFQVWLALASCRGDAGDAAGSRDAAERVLALQPRNSAAYRLRALARANLGDVEGALADATWLRDNAPELVARDESLQALIQKLQR